MNLKTNLLRAVGAVALAFTAVQSVAAETLCSRDVMCIVTVDKGNTVDVLIENRQSAEITVTLAPAVNNLAVDAPLPHTATYPGNATTKAFSLAVVDSELPHSLAHTYRWTWGPLTAAHDDKAVYRLPYERGKFYRVDQGHHGRFSHFGDFEYAVDWNMPIGTPVLAAREGVVVGVKDIYEEGGPSREYENLCNYIMIKHADGTIGEYDHLSAYSAKVKVGDKVRAGDLLALSGNSGFTTGPHLHFFVYKALDGGHRESFPVQFRLDDNGAGSVVEGRTYMAY